MTTRNNGGRGWVGVCTPGSAHVSAPSLSPKVLVSRRGLDVLPTDPKPPLGHLGNDWPISSKVF